MRAEEKFITVGQQSEVMMETRDPYNDIRKFLCDNLHTDRFRINFCSMRTCITQLLEMTLLSSLVLFDLSASPETSGRE